MEGVKSMKLIKGDASERKFYRKRNNKISKIIIHSSINKRKNLLNYDSVNKILLKNKIRAPKLISENYKKNLIEIEDLGDKTLFKIFQKCKNTRNCLELEKKPLSLTNLIQKINLCFLKNQFSNQSNLKMGKYFLDLNSRKINLENIYLDLTEKETELLLFMNSNKKMSLREIQSKVWGYSKSSETHTVETHVYRLRKKMLETFEDNKFILHDKSGYFLN